MLKSEEIEMTPRDLILKSCAIPAVPMVALKVIRVVDDPYASLEDLQKIIIADQALATRVLKVANSAFYGTRQNIDTISHAIAVMGVNAIKMITLAVSTREVYKQFGIIEQKLWEHSLGVSLASGIIAADIALLSREEAVVAGLLHDIGKVIMNNSQPERFSILTQMVYERRVPYASIEKNVFGFGHAEVGFLLAEKWGFPPLLCDVIREHHTWDSAGRNNGDSSVRTLCAVVSLADALCVKLGVGYRGPVAYLDLGEEKWRTMLDISDQRFTEITNIFKTSYVQERMFYMEHKCL